MHTATTHDIEMASETATAATKCYKYGLPCEGVPASSLVTAIGAIAAATLVLKGLLVKDIMAYKAESSLKDNNNGKRRSKRSVYTMLFTGRPERPPPDEYGRKRPRRTKRGTLFHDLTLTGQVQDLLKYGRSTKQSLVRSTLITKARLFYYPSAPPLPLFSLSRCHCHCEILMTKGFYGRATTQTVQYCQGETKTFLSFSFSVMYFFHGKICVSYEVALPRVEVARGISYSNNVFPPFLNCMNS